jgi:hypothetical protein
VEWILPAAAIRLPSFVKSLTPPLLFITGHLSKSFESCLGPLPLAVCHQDPERRGVEDRKAATSSTALLPALVAMRASDAPSS